MRYGQNLLHESKTEIFVFTPTRSTFLTENTRCTLSAYIKPTAETLVEFLTQTSASNHTSTNISKIKPMLPQSHIEKIIHSIIFSILDCCDSILSGDINNKSLIITIMAIPKCSS